MKVNVMSADLGKAFDRVMWAKLLFILKMMGTAWKENRLMKKLYMDQNKKVRTGTKISKKIGIRRRGLTGLSFVAYFV